MFQNISRLYDSKCMGVVNEFLHIDHERSEIHTSILFVLNTVTEYKHEINYKTRKPSTFTLPAIVTHPSTHYGICILRLHLRCQV